MEKHFIEQKLNSSARTSASEQLNHVIDKIMIIWEQRVRENITSASSKSTSVLRCQLHELLENLASSISPLTSSIENNETGKIGKVHGQQRAALCDYTFSQVLHEYRILRQVIFEVLEEENLQITNVRDIILNVLDEGIENAIEQFSFIRSEELKRSNRDLEHFAAIAAHDLKSPLATIIGFTELLKESLQGKVGIDEYNYLQSIQRSSAYMAILIDRLLEYSAVGRQIKPFENVSSTQILINVLETLLTPIESSKATILFENLPVIWGDSSLLSQLFQNFISNALKFQDPKKKLVIHVSAKEESQNWLFSVQDNGIGFDPKDKESIFSLFKRLDNVNLQKGSGIGLATARKVVELHGGKVWAESQPAFGSTFFFTLPKMKH